MRIADAHTHLHELSNYAIRQLVLTGVREVVLFSKPVFRLSGYTSYLDHYERLIRFEKARLESLGMKCYVALGISPTAMIKDPFSLTEHLKDYLALDFVVAIGECSLKDTNDSLQVETLKLMLELSKIYGKPVFIDVEDAKRHVFKKIMALMELTGTPADLVVLNGISTINALDMMEEGFWLSFNLWPPRDHTDTLAEKIFKGDFPLDRVLLTSNLDSTSEDVLLLPKVALEMELRGYDPIVIERVLWENPKKLFSRG